MSGSSGALSPAAERATISRIFSKFRKSPRASSAEIPTNSLPSSPVNPPQSTPTIREPTQPSQEKDISLGETNAVVVPKLVEPSDDSLEPTTSTTTTTLPSDHTQGDHSLTTFTEDDKEEDTPSPSFTAALSWSTSTLALKPIRTLRYRPSKPTDSPLPLWGHVMCPIPGRESEFLVFGGFQHDENCTGEGKCEGTLKNDIYILSATDLSLTQIETGGDAPTPRFLCGGAVVGRVLIVWGTPADPAMYFLDLNIWNWTTFQPMGPTPDAREFHTITAWDKTIFVFGGRTDSEGDTERNDLWSFNVSSLVTLSPHWERIRLPPGPPIPARRSQHTCVVYNDKLYIFGGGSNTGDLRQYYNDTWEFDIAKQTWRELACKGSVPEARDRHTAVVIGDIMYIFGGMSSTGIMLQDRLALHIPDQRWYTYAVMGRPPSRRTTAAMAPYGDKCLVFGGHTPETPGKKIDTAPHLHILNCRADTTMLDLATPLARLQFTTEVTNLNFSTPTIDLSRYISKSGDAAHALAGFSDIWRGELSDTGQIIAIKILRGSDRESEITRKRFKREMTVWIDLRHERILELLGYAFIEGVPCLVSPWCANGNVLEYLTRNPETDKTKRLSLIAQIVDGLVYLHTRDPVVIHADIKPANVLIDDDGDCKVCDFGISKLVQENQSAGLTTTINMKGTLRYMAPEMLVAGGECNTKTDVYAFGMLALEIMTGKCPFYNHGRNELTLLYAISQGQRPDSEHYAELPADHPLWVLLQRCWHEDPEKRPTMVEARDEINTIAGAQAA